MFSLNALWALLQILFIDLSLAGDNALVVGVAAAGLREEKRKHLIFAGIAAATVLRVIFAVFAVQLLHLPAFLVAGGLMLLWVCWKLFHDLRHLQLVNKASIKNSELPVEAHEKPHPRKKSRDAILQIVIADISMSLDNVLAVAGAAREHLKTLIFGLVLSVGLMGVASGLVAKLVTRFPAVGYIGLAIVLYTSVRMIWDGSQLLLPNVNF